VGQIVLEPPSKKNRHIYCMPSVIGGDFEKSYLHNCVRSTPDNMSMANAEGLSPESKIFSTPLEFNDSFAALIASMYHAASLIVHRVLHHCSLPNILISNPNFYAQQATSNATSVFQIVTLLQPYRPVGFGSMRCAFPLIVVALVSPSTEQRMVATATLQIWGSSRGFNGLCNAWMSF